MYGNQPNQQNQNPGAKTSSQSISAQLPSGQKIDEIKEGAREFMTDASQKLSKGYDVAKTELKKAGGQLEGVVKENPLMALAVAAGVGALLGGLLFPRFGNHSEEADYKGYTA